MTKSYFDEKYGLINKKEVCYLLGISVSSLYWLKKFNKSFPKPYIENHIFGQKWKRDRVVKWLMKNCKAFNQDYTGKALTNKDFNEAED